MVVDATMGTAGSRSEVTLTVNGRGGGVDIEGYVDGDGDRCQVAGEITRPSASDNGRPLESKHGRLR